MWNLAVDLAERRQRVLFVTLEMTPSDIGLQALSRFSRIPLERIRQAHNADAGVNLSDDEDKRLTAAADRLKKLEFTLRLHGARDGRSLDSVMRAATAVRFDAIFIDHIGMVDRGNGNPFDALARSVDAFRGLAKGEHKDDYRPFVCATSPLNRAGEAKDKSGEDRLPQLCDFAGSAQIESDADFAMILRKRQKDEAPDDDATPDIVDGFVLKNRQGQSPLVLQFEAQGEVCFVREREPVRFDPIPPQSREQRRPQRAAPHWQSSEED